MKSLFIFLNLVMAATSFRAFSQTETKSKAENPKYERVGGTFLVSDIKKLSDGSFRVVFKATSEKPLLKELILESTHVHMSVNVGQELRLSADVLDQVNGIAKVGQMVLFMPGRNGPTPVWLLSKNFKAEAPPAKLIEMHAPSTDFQVL